MAPLPHRSLQVQRVGGRPFALKRYVVQDALARAEGMTPLYAMTSVSALQNIVNGGSIIASRAGTSRADRLIEQATGTDQTTDRSITTLDHELLELCPSWFRLWGTTKRPATAGMAERYLMSAGRTPELTMVLEVPTDRLAGPGLAKRVLFQPSAKYIIGQTHTPISSIREIIAHSAATRASITADHMLMQGLTTHNIPLSLEVPGEDASTASSLWGATRTAILPGLFTASPAIAAFAGVSEPFISTLTYGVLAINGLLVASMCPPEVLRAYRMLVQRANRSSQP